ncbi:uncharacterized protein C2orf42 homolog isoform X3 [Scyliorhinus canicula]|uniref:uncharacterized protein C2orf42 homolog isoform X3 n=1 Tax=Scyliorhinus canicula TaxID=7830 RepID=UPI0018F6C01D|nr:uncharacterized protein C2orf42 homolog isoform X3 [Scyliorhinus canicula]
MEQHPERTKTLAFLADLGKPTLRGIKKCPKCGTINGTRGLSCKNKSCGAVFRDGVRKQLPSIDAVRIVTGSASQVYSVRLRDRGPDYRGFVELGTSEAVQTVDGTIITHITGRCFVPTCFKVSTQGASEYQCQHVKLATECHLEATPHTLKSSVLNSLQVSSETKQAIWTLATESSGPLVQRITKSIMVVKCKASTKHSLGFLHVSFHEKARMKGVTERKFYCSCQAFKASKPGSIKEESPKRCIHFYACVCAFASDEKLGQEFSYFINFHSTGRFRRPGLQANTETQLLAIYPQDPTSQAAVSAVSKARKKKKDDITGGPSHWCSTSPRSFSTPCSRGYPWEAKRNACPTSPQVLFGRTPCLWERSPSTLGRSQTFFRSSRYLTPRRCLWKLPAVSLKTAMARTSYLSAPKFRWKVLPRRTAGWRSSQQFGRWSSRRF